VTPPCRLASAFPTFAEEIGPDGGEAAVAINPAWVEAVRPVSSKRCVVYLAGPQAPRRIYLLHPMHDVVAALAKAVREGGE
jgi:hypothetical protein